MAVAIGSTNRVKVEALEEVLKGYPAFEGVGVVAVSIPSKVADQPMSLNETLQGAINRARGAFEGVSGSLYGVGIESGLTVFEEGSGRFFDVTLCCIYDGESVAIGQSCAFALPPQVVELIVHQGLDLGQACLAAGLTTNSSLGTAEGAIGLLTRGRMTRKAYTCQAISMAMIQIENAPLYSYQRA